MRTYGVQRARPEAGHLTSPGWTLFMDGQALRTYADCSEALSVGARMAQSDWTRRNTPAEVLLLDERGAGELFTRFGESAPPGTKSAA
jgi:hypothetical protein